MEQLEKDLAQLHNLLGVPGFSIAAVKKDKILLMKGFGLADIKREIPATSDTVYMWFSLTKIATATAVMQLVEQGKLRLDDKVTDFIPVFPVSTNGQVATIRHLLNHSSGLKNPMPVRWIHAANELGPDPQIFLKRLLDNHGKLTSNPGEKANYSNIGYLALGIIITASSGMPYKDYILAKVLRPIGMNQTDFHYREDMIERAAVGYEKRWSALSLALPFLRIPKGVLGEKVGDYVSFNRFYPDGSAYGGLIGPAKDAIRLVQAHINGGTVEGVQILSKESVALMQCISSKSDKLDVGYGWFRSHSSLEQISYLHQLGGGGGFFNIMRIYPMESFGMVVMGNCTSYNVETIIEIIPKHYQPTTP